MTYLFYILSSLYKCESFYSRFLTKPISCRRKYMNSKKGTEQGENITNCLYCDCHTQNKLCFFQILFDFGPLKMIDYLTTWIKKIESKKLHSLWTTISNVCKILQSFLVSWLRNTFQKELSVNLALIHELLTKSYWYHTDR